MRNIAITARPVICIGPDACKWEYSLAEGAGFRNVACFTFESAEARKHIAASPCAIIVRSAGEASDLETVAAAGQGAA